jgi:quinol monooxygenase YgiN
MIALVVSLKIKPDQRERFLAAAEDDSISSVRDEGGGCLRFDVLHDEEDENHFLFYEVYQDEAAYEAHTQTLHFARWVEARQLTVEDVSRQRCTVLFPRDYVGSQARAGS